MRAVDAMMECLKAEGVEAVFGIPGGANLPTYDALYDAGIRNVLCRHEQGAGHAAEGYAKATGKVGVALATSGPGATNLVTAIADAVMDSVPTVFITGQVRTDLMGTDGFQEADTIGITMPIVKHSLQVLDPRELPHCIHEAFHLARSGRPGPVLVDIPQDLSRADIPYEPSEAAEVDLPGYRTFDEGNVKQIRLAAKALANARRPIIYSGGGVVNGNAAEELRELVTTGRFPITSTVMGLGAFPAPHEQWLGMLGMHGTRTANYAMDNADLIVAVGSRFDDRITGKLSEFAPRAKFIHIDVDPAEISKNVPGPHPDRRRLQEDPAQADGRVPRARHRRRRGSTSGGSSCGAGRTSGRCATSPAREGEIPPQRMVQAMYEATKGDAIITSDVGQHQMWAAQWYPFSRPRQWINSGGLGTMGFGLPSAIGAKIGCPDDLVVCLAGDGSLIMNCQELATAVEHDVAVKVFIMNNGYLGMVRQWQELFWDKRYSAVEMGSSPDWVKLAEAFGAVGMRVTHDDEVDDAMRTAIETEGPVVLDVHVRKEENCYPMIPAGAPARDMVGGEEGVAVLAGAAARPRARGPPMGEPGTQEVVRLEDLEASSIYTGRKHVLSVLVENKPGVLTRIAGLFSRRGFNIDTLAVGPTEDPNVSRMTIALDGANHPIDQVTKQLHKLVNVIKIRDLEPEETIAREMALFKVQADGATRGEIMQLADIFRGRIIDVSNRTATIEVTGTQDKIEAFEQMVRPFGLVEMVRTGEIAIARGKGQT